MLPCCEYEKTPDTREESGLTLVTSSSSSSSPVHPALAELDAQDAAEDAQIAADAAQVNWTDRPDKWKFADQLTADQGPSTRTNDPLPVSRSRSAGANEQRRVTFQLHDE